MKKQNKLHIKTADIDVIEFKIKHIAEVSYFDKYETSHCYDRKLLISARKLRIVHFDDEVFIEILDKKGEIINCLWFDVSEKIKIAIDNREIIIEPVKETNENEKENNIEVEK